MKPLSRNREALDKWLEYEKTTPNFFGVAKVQGGGAA